MEKIEKINFQIDGIKEQLDLLNEAYENIVEAMAGIRELDILDDEYTQLDLIAQGINDQINVLESQLTQLEEDLDFELNKDRWKLDKELEEWEYERSVL